MSNFHIQRVRISLLSMLLMTYIITFPMVSASASASLQQQKSLSDYYTTIPTLFDDTYNNNNEIIGLEYESSMYDKYAACLAATEGLRRIRNEQIIKNVNKKQKQAILNKYTNDSKQLLKSLGLLSLEEFNNIGYEVLQNQNLKKRVIEQAYLYRIAGSVHLDHIPVTTQKTKFTSPTTRIGRTNEVLVGSNNRSLDKYSSDNIIMNTKNRLLERFCYSMKEVECLRLIQVERLKVHLGIQDLPIMSSPSILNNNDPTTLQLLHPKVQETVTSFTQQAQDIVTNKYGIQINEFNHMLHKIDNNLFFRWRVQRILHQQQQQQHTK